MYSLNHRFQLVGVIYIEDTEELLGAGIIAERPQASAGTAGKKYYLHRLIIFLTSWDY